MTYTEKVLEAYCKKFGLCKEKGTCQCKKELKFIAESIAQAIAEERERVMVVIDRKRKNILWEKHNRLDINADESKGYNKALDDLLSSLDTDKQN